MDSPIIVVSGLPRSGTSLMMQMLANGSVEIVTDHVRTADTDNPRGYYELEKVKRLRQDSSWLPEARGKAFKMVSQLLYDLPATERYRIVFMERDLDEILDSQEKMLVRLGLKVPPRERIRASFVLHLERLHDWLRQQRNMGVLCVNYNVVLARPEEQAGRVLDFLGRKASVAKLVEAIDPSLYRNRKTPGES
jgi:hypothetical protein